MIHDRRTFLRLVGASSAGSVALASTAVASAPDGPEVVTLENVGADSPGSPIAPDDGFADLGWLEDGPLVVVRVTTLDATGEGSFKWACEVGYDELDAEDVGRRIVVFEVGGVIDLEDTDIQAERKNIYVAGQTAPTPGITLVRANGPGVEFDEENHFVQHIRSMPGDQISEPADSMVAGDDAHNVVFDHCTVTWGTEESMSVNAGSVSERFTFSNNLIGEGLFDSPVHSSDPQRAYGTLVGNDADAAAIIGNLYVHTWSRNPRLKGGTQALVANNVWYNFEHGMRIGGDVDAPNYVNAVGNHYRAGEAADFDTPLVYTSHDDDDPPIHIYLENNSYDDGYTPIDENDPFEIEGSPITEYWPASFTPIDGDPYDQVLSHAGARPAERTEVEERLIADVENRTGEIIDSQDEVGGYPQLEETAREIELLEGDITDWLRAHTRAVELGDVPPGEENGADPEDLDVTGDSNPAQDLTGDGLYEDVTGDGRLSFDDVVTFFEEHEGAPVQDNVEHFDFSDDGRVGFTDVVALFELL